MKIRNTFPILALAFLALPANAAGEIIEERRFAVGSGSTLIFDSDRGGVTIIGENRDDIHLQVEAREMDADDAREALDLTIHETGAGVEIQARFKERGWLSNLFGGGSGSVHYQVRVPRRTDLQLDNGSGGIVAEQIEGRVSVDNGSGGIRLRGILGDVSVDNGSGGIRIEEIRGDLVVDNGSGGVRAVDVRGDVSIDNGSGGVRLEGIEGALEVETSSGGVSARMTGANAGIRAETGSGGVRIHVPSGWGADVEMRSSSGDIMVRGFPGIDLDDAERFSGRVGGGGPRITMTSSSGDVALIAD